MSQLQELGKTLPEPQESPPATEAEASYVQQQLDKQRRRPNIIGSIISHHKTSAIAGSLVMTALGVSTLIPGCEGSPVQTATQVGELGGVLRNVVIPKYPLGIIEGDGTGTGQVIQAKYLHLPKLPLIGFISDAANGVLEKVYRTSAISKVKTSVEIMLASGALTLKPYKLPPSSNSTPTHGIGGMGVEADVRVGGLSSVLIDKMPTSPNESSGAGFGSRISDVVLGNSDTTLTDNAATTVAKTYFQYECGRSLLDNGKAVVGVEKLVQTVFKLDAQYFKSFPGVSPTLDKQMLQLSNETPHVVFTHYGEPIDPNKISHFLHDFGPPLPTSQNVAKLVDNTPANVTVPRDFNGCTSTSYAIGQQEKLIQQAAAATVGTAVGTKG